MFRQFFKWVFKNELHELEKKMYAFENTRLEMCKTHERIKVQEQKINNVLSNIDISVDVHEYHKYSRSWAVISLQGSKTDYIKFVDLGDKEVRDISSFLRNYERNANIKIDASPQVSGFLRIPRF